MRMLRVLSLILIVTACFLGLGAPPAVAGRRIALVIGNSAYQHTAPLKNPKNDALDLAEAFRSLGFEVLVGTDLDKPAMERLLIKFAQSIKGADVGVVFYAGHGLQVGNQNYLVPIDARLEDSSGLDFELVRLDLVHRTMERETQTNIIFLDACRDNPLGRNLARAMGTRSQTIGRGLAPVESGVGTLISFSTQPGNVALDGSGRNSPFAAALAKRIVEPGSELSGILISVRNDVIAATNSKQIPWEHSALRARLYFGEQPEPEPLKPSGKDYDKEMEIAFWNAVKDSKDAAILGSYLERFPNGTFASLARIMTDRLNQEQAAQAALAERERDLRRAEDARRTAEAARAEEQRKVAEAHRREEERKGKESQRKVEEARNQEVLRQAELARARDEERKAQEAVRVAEAERIVAAKAADDLARPASIAIPGGGTNNPVASGQAADPSALIRALQTELKRVGCDPGAVDGKWGGKARDALNQFVRLTKLDVDTSEPSQSALGAVAGQKGRICPPACGANQVERDGSCMTRPALPPAPPKVPAADTNAGARARAATTQSNRGLPPCQQAGRNMPGTECRDEQGRRCYIGGSFGNRSCQ